MAKFSRRSLVGKVGSGKGSRNRVALLAIVWVTLAVATVALRQAQALSRMVPEPDIFFPKEYDKQKAQRILSVLQDKKFHYLDGLTSFWEPEFGTYLNYDGNTAALEQFVTDLTKLKGVQVKVSFSRSLKMGSWQVDYVHTAPDTLTVLVNLKSEQLDLEKLHLPAWGNAD